MLITLQMDRFKKAKRILIYNPLVIEIRCFFDCLFRPYFPLLSQRSLTQSQKIELGNWKVLKRTLYSGLPLSIWQKVWKAESLCEAKKIVDQEYENDQALGITWPF